MPFGLLVIPIWLIGVMYKQCCVGINIKISNRRSKIVSNKIIQLNKNVICILLHNF